MDEFVVVDAPDLHREVFLGWLGSSAWSGEYTEGEWSEAVDPVSRHYGPHPYLTITVRQRTS